MLTLTGLSSTISKSIIRNKSIFHRLRRKLSTASNHIVDCIPFFAGTHDYPESKVAERKIIEKFWLEFLTTMVDEPRNQDCEPIIDSDHLYDEKTRVLNVPKNRFVKKYRHEVFDILSNRRDLIRNEKDLISLQFDIEAKTMHFSEESIHASCPSVMNLLTRDGVTAKEFLRGYYRMDKTPGGRMIFDNMDSQSLQDLPAEERKKYHSVLSDRDKSLLLLFGEHTLECLLVNTLCYMFNMNNQVSLASLIDRIESSVRLQAKIIRENSRSENVDENVESENDVDDQKRQDKSCPLAIPLVEYLERKGAIRFTHHYTDEVHQAESTDGIPKTFVKRVSKKKKSYYRSSFVYAECTFNTALLPVKFNLPMVYPPEDWSILRPPPGNESKKSKGVVNITDIVGGYLSKPCGVISSQRTMSSPDPKSFYIYFDNDEKAKSFCATISSLQRVGFKINEHLLNDILSNRSFFEKRGFLMPSFLSNLIVSEATGILRTIFDKEEYKEIRSLFRFSELVCILMKNMQQARYECTLIDMAYAYKGYRIYFPAFIDFRGRIYRSGILHFHERDFSRSLLLLDYEHDNQYHCVKIEDKVDLALCLERYATATAFLYESFLDEHKLGRRFIDMLSTTVLEKNLEEVKEIIGDSAMKSKRPLQYYSNCLLLSLSIKSKNPTKLDLCYSVPITLDASASAYQLMAYFLLDETMAVKTNLFDTAGHINDIYLHIREKLLLFMKKELQHENAPLCAILDRILTRSIVKKIFMPMIYGKTLNSSIKDLMSSLSQDVLPKECVILATLCFRFWKNHFHSKEGLINLCRFLGRICSSLERPVLYSTPLFTTSQDSKKMESCSVRVYDTKLKRRRSVTLTFPSTARDKKKSCGSTFVNLIHQKDATVAMNMVFYSGFLKIPLYTVHDNFISNAIYSMSLTDGYQQAFRNLGPPLTAINRLIYVNLIEPEIENVDRRTKGTYSFSLEYFDEKIIPKSVLEDFLSYIPPSESKNRAGWKKIKEGFIRSYIEYCKSVCGPQMEFYEHKRRWEMFQSKIVGRYCLHH